MTLETATDLAGLMDSQDFADTVTLEDNSTFLAFYHQGYADSLDINGRRPVLLAISAAVGGVTEGTSVTVASPRLPAPTLFTVQAIEAGDRTTRLFLEKQ